MTYKALDHYCFLLLVHLLFHKLILIIEFTIILGQNPLTFMIPIYSTTVLYDSTTVLYDNLQFIVTTSRNISIYHNIDTASAKNKMIYSCIPYIKLTLPFKVHIPRKYHLPKTLKSIKYAF